MTIRLYDDRKGKWQSWECWSEEIADLWIYNDVRGYGWNEEQSKEEYIKELQKLIKEYQNAIILCQETINELTK